MKVFVCKVAYILLFVSSVLIIHGNQPESKIKRDKTKHMVRIAWHSTKIGASLMSILFWAGLIEEYLKGRGPKATFNGWLASYKRSWVKDGIWTSPPFVASAIVSCVTLHSGIMGLIKEMQDLYSKPRLKDV